MEWYFYKKRGQELLKEDVNKFAKDLPSFFWLSDMFKHISSNSAQIKIDDIEIIKIRKNNITSNCKVSKIYTPKDLAALHIKGADDVDFDNNFDYREKLIDIILTYKNLSEDLIMEIVYKNETSGLFINSTVEILESKNVSDSVKRRILNITKSPEVLERYLSSNKNKSVPKDILEIIVNKNLIPKIGSWFFEEYCNSYKSLVCELIKDSFLDNDLMLKLINNIEKLPTDTIELYEIIAESKDIDINNLNKLYELVYKNKTCESLYVLVKIIRNKNIDLELSKKIINIFKDNNKFSVSYRTSDLWTYSELYNKAIEAYANKNFLSLEDLNGILECTNDETVLQLIIMHPKADKTLVKAALEKNTCYETLFAVAQCNLLDQELKERVLNFEYEDQNYRDEVLYNLYNNANIKEEDSFSIINRTTNPATLFSVITETSPSEEKTYKITDKFFGIITQMDENQYNGEAEKSDLDTLFAAILRNDFITPQIFLKIFNSIDYLSEEQLILLSESNKLNSSIFNFIFEGANNNDDYKLFSDMLKVQKRYILKESEKQSETSEIPLLEFNKEYAKLLLLYLEKTHQAEFRDLLLSELLKIKFIKKEHFYDKNYCKECGRQRKLCITMKNIVNEVKL